MYLYYDPAIVNITKIENCENGFETLTYYDSGTSGVKGNNIEFANITFYGKSNGIAKLGILVEELFNNSGVSLMPVTVNNGTVTVQALLPKIHIYTDKINYSIGQTQKLGLELKNPNREIEVVLKVWLTGPLPASFNNNYSKSFKLPKIPLGNYTWNAQLSDPSTREVISSDTTIWYFVG